VQQGKCHYDKAEGKVLSTSVNGVTPKNVAQLKAAVAKGPVSTAVESNMNVFMHYKKGVLNTPDCG